MHSYNFLPILIRPIIAVSAMAAFIFYFRMVLGLALLIASSAALYFAVIFMLRSFDSKDYEIFRKILGKPTKKQLNLPETN